MRHPRSLAAAAVIALLLLASGCGGDDAKEPVASPSATTSTTGTSDSGGSIDKVEFIDGLLAAIDAKDSVHLSIKAGPTGSGQADISYGADGTKIKVDGKLPGSQRTTFVIAGGFVYVEQASGKYIRIGTDDPTYGALLSTFSEIGPHESVAGLGYGLESVSRVGPDTLGKVPVDVYRAFVDPTTANGAFKALAGSNPGASSMEFTLYVDAGDLLRKVEVEVDGQMTEVTLSDWGKPVRVTVPKGSQVVRP
jgi:hypothetical protein